jgi:hypothetical protein
MAPADPNVAPYQVVSDLSVSKRVPPQLPPGADGTGLGVVKCYAKVWISLSGQPVRVIVAVCPVEFHGSVVEALLQWRWNPSLVEGRPVPVITTVGVTFNID